MTRVNSTGKESISNFSPDNGTGLAVRTAIKDILESLRTVNSAAGDPSGTANLAAYQLHIDSDTDTLKIRNGANSAFVTLGNVSQTNFGFLSAAGGTMTGALLADDSGTASSPAISFDNDTDLGYFRKSANVLGFSANGTEQLFLSQNGITLNAQNEIRFNDNDSSNYIGFKAANNVNSNISFILPSTDGTNGQSLITNGSGTLSFGTPTISTATNFDVTSNITAAKAKVNSIIPKNGLPSGASGGIIQTVQTVKTDGFSTTSNSFVDITGMSVTITPQSSTSKVMIEVLINMSANSVGGVRVLRGSTPVGISTAVSGSNRVNATFGASSDNLVTVNTFGVKFFDSPATTNATTYKLQVYLFDAESGSAFFLNRPHNLENLSRTVGTISSITAYEVTE
tara:strand:- start:114 stop:1307 length:1194 start_codon:yes stop_codon:yes gene_type:complete